MAKSGQFSSILGMVAAGIGISIAPEMALERRPDSNFVLISDERAAALKGHFLGRAPQAFLAHLRSQAQSRRAAAL